MGDDAFVLLARVRCASTGEDDVPVDEAGGNIGPYDMRLSLDDGRARLVGASNPTDSEWGAAPGTELWAVVYDIDDNNQIDFGDFSFFAAAFGKDAGPPRREKPYTWWADFDKSGLVDFGDLSFFAPNFNKTRAAVQSNAQTLIFPPNFPEAWRAGAGGGSGQAGEGEWQGLGGAAAWDVAALAGEDAEIAPGQAGDRFVAVLPSTSAEAFAGPVGLPGARHVHAVTDRAFALIGAEGTERWTGLRPESTARQWGGIERHQRPVRLGGRWEPLEDTLSLLVERTPSQVRDDVLDPLDSLFAQFGR